MFLKQTVYNGGLMTEFNPQLLEDDAKKRLLDAGVVEQLKKVSAYIWALNAYPDRIIIAVDITENKNLDFEKVETLIQYVLKDFSDEGIEIALRKLSIREQCCYGNCKGCLNGDIETHPVWIGKKFN